MLKASYYNFVLETEDRTLLIYNSRTGAFVAIPEALSRSTQELLLNPSQRPEENLTKTLFDKGFIVDERYDEFIQVKERFLNFQNSKKGTVLTLLASEDCNFRCPYCFIYDRRGIGMRAWVYDAVLRMIERNAVSGTRLLINWFGGEPTLEKENILKFMCAAGSLAKKSGLSISSRMITNGYLLSANAFGEYVKSGITMFQITLDGDEASHNVTRPLKNGHGTFNVIWSNLEKIKNTVSPNLEFRVLVRVNFLKGQEEKIRSLTGMFRSVFGSDKRFSIYFRPVTNMPTAREDISAVAKDICSITEGISKQMEYQLMFANTTGELDLKSPASLLVPDPIPGWCMAERKNFWAVGADGLLFKCDTYVGDTSKANGKLKEDGSIDLFNKTFEWDLSIYDAQEAKCLRCKFLPICQGGCARNRAKRIAENNCVFNEQLIKRTMLGTHEFYKKQEAFHSNGK